MEYPMKIFAIIALAASFTFADWFTPKTNGTVLNVGAQAGFAGIFNLVDQSNGCALYYLPNTTEGKAMFTTVLQAYSAGLQVNRVDYTKSSNTCYVSLVSVGPFGGLGVSN